MEIFRFFKNLSHKKAGLALGSGGAKGIAHIGVIEVFEKNNIYPQEISGCSIGAVIGALYASGIPIKEIRDLALSINFKKSLELFDFSNPREGGIVKGKLVLEYLESILPVRTFKQLQLPFSCVATDIKTGKPVVFTKGDLIPALRASISIPGFFIPFEYQGKTLIDGSLVNPVPVNLLTRSRYRIAVIVDEYDRFKKISLAKSMIENKIRTILQEKVFPRFSSLPNIMKKRVHKKANTFDVLSLSLDIISHELTRFHINDYDVDLIIRPDVKHIPTLAFYLGKQSYKEGVKAAKKALGQINEDL